MWVHQLSCRIVPLARVSLIELADHNRIGTFKGHFGVGKDFFETQRDGGFFSKDASPEDLRHFLEFTGVQRKSVDR